MHCVSAVSSPRGVAALSGFGGLLRGIIFVSCSLSRRGRAVACLALPCCGKGDHYWVRVRVTTALTSFSSR